MRMIQVLLKRIFTSTALVMVLLSSIGTILSCQGFTIQRSSPMRSITSRVTTSKSNTSRVKTNVAMEDFQFSLEVDGVNDDEINDRSGLVMEEEGKSSKGAPKQKPIRRQRRSKKVPLIAIVGRPNVGKNICRVL